MSRSILGAAIAAAAGFGALSSSANAAILSDLIDSNGTVQVGDKLFSNFAYARTGDMPDASAVTVSSQIDLDQSNNPIAWGIRFSGTFGDLPGNGASDALITYTVTVLDPYKAISDAHIAGNPIVFGAGAMVITETFLPENATAKIKVYDIKPGANQLADWTNFLPNTYTTIHVQKDILADAGDSFEQPLAFTAPQSGAFMTFVDQTFSQVPEPASLGVLALAAPALLLRRRK